MSADPKIGEAMRDAGRKASECLRVYWTERTIPVDPVRIAERLGAKVLQSDLPPTVSGAVLKNAGQDPIILVDQSESEARKRFTIAHELGHYVRRAEEDAIDYVDLRGPGARLGTDPEEVYANNFAANLLMPADEVKRAWKELGTDDCIPAIALSERFLVSLDAISHRLRNLNLRD
jgi:Zn-dependent peptidase ImmA (M78 family)